MAENIGNEVDAGRPGETGGAPFAIDTDYRADLEARALFIGRPETGETDRYVIEPGQPLKLGFDLDEAEVSQTDTDIILTFADGSVVVFSSMVDAAFSDEPPILLMADGQLMTADQLLEESGLIDAIADALDGVETEAGEGYGSPVTNYAGQQAFGEGGFDLGGGFPINELAGGRGLPLPDRLPPEFRPLGAVPGLPDDDGSGLPDLPDGDPGGEDDLPEITGEMLAAVREDLALSDAGAVEAEGAVFEGQTTIGSYGTFQLSSDGSWNYALNNESSAVQALKEGETVTETFAIEVDGAAVSGSIEVTITGTNDAPEVSAVLLNGEEDITVTITEAELLAAVTDVDGDALSVRDLSADSGALVDNGDGSWTFTPDHNFSGTVVLDYNVTDGIETVPASSSIEIAGIADTPTLTVLLGDGVSIEGDAGSIEITKNNFDQGDLGFTVLGRVVNSDGTLSEASADYVARAGNGFGADDSNVGPNGLIGYDLGQDISEQLIISFDDLMSGATINVGSLSGEESGHYELRRDGVTVGSGDFTGGSGNSAELALMAEDGDGFDEIIFTATVPEDDGAAGAASGSDFMIESVSASILDPLDGGLEYSLDITAALTDLDGSETLSITIDGLPETAELSSGTDNGDGSWTLEAGDLPGLMVRVPAGVGAFDLTVTATASENGTSASVSSIVSVEPEGFTLIGTLSDGVESLIFGSDFEEDVSDHAISSSHLVDEIDGWRSDDDGIEVWSEEGRNPDTPDGAQYIELNTDPSGKYFNAGNIYREIETEQGYSYSLTFSYAGRPGYGPEVNAMDLLVNGQVVGSYDQDASTSSRHDWQTVTVEFTGTGEPVRLEFMETGTDVEYGRGMRLDDIQLIAVSPGDDQDDILIGGAGDDLIYGDQDLTGTGQGGDDTLVGGKGSDWIVGGGDRGEPVTLDNYQEAFEAGDQIWGGEEAGRELSVTELLLERGEATIEQGAEAGEALIFETHGMLLDGGLAMGQVLSLLNQGADNGSMFRISWDAGSDGAFSWESGFLDVTVPAGEALYLTMDGHGAGIIYQLEQPDDAGGWLPVATAAGATDYDSELDGLETTVPGDGEQDVFFFREGDGVDTIHDFEIGMDQLVISGYEREDMTILADGEDTIIQLGDAGEAIKLIGVNAAEVGQEDNIASYDADGDGNGTLNADEILTLKDDLFGGGGAPTPQDAGIVLVAPVEPGINITPNSDEQPV